MTVAAMQLAGQQMGLNENAQNAALSEYMSNGGVNLDPAVTAWCAAFVNASLAQTGLEGTGSNMARSFENWGQAVDTPQRGDLAVFHRNGIDSGFGHVGFFEGYDDNGNILVLGGNQGNSVSVAPYSADSLLGFRRAPGEGQNALATLGGQNAPSEQDNALQAFAQFQQSQTPNMLSANAFARPVSQAQYMPIPGVS